MQPDIQNEPEVIQMLRAFRRSLLAREDAQLDRMAQEWLRLEFELAAEMDALAEQIVRSKAEGLVITEQLVWRMQKYERMKDKMDREIARFIDEIAVPDIEAEQREFGQVGLDMAQGVLSAQALGMGIDFDPLSSDAVETYIGFLGDGTPLHRLLDEAFPEAVDGVIKALLDGVARGFGPEQVARMMAEGMGLGLERITLIARTEQLRVWRATAADQYKNSGLEGFQRRLVTKDDRTCMACLVSDGEIIPADAVLDDHPRGRCTSVFQIKGAPEITWPSAQDWFLEQTDEVQQQMMGMEKWVMWINGQFELPDLRKTDHSPIWGDSPRVATLAELGGRRGDLVLGVGPDRPDRGPAGGLDEAEMQRLLDEVLADRERAAALRGGTLNAEEQARQDALDAARAAEIEKFRDAAVTSGEILPVPSFDDTDVRTSDDGVVITQAEGAHSQGAFDSERVTIAGNGDAIIKTNDSNGSWGDLALTEGFARREVMTYELDQALGIGLVPRTTAFVEGENFNSLQLWVDGANVGVEVGSREVPAVLVDESELGRLALLDMITGNVDRHEYNWLLTDDGHLVAIDNGLAMTTSTESPQVVFDRMFNRFTAFDFVSDQKDNNAYGDRRLPLPSSYRDELARMLETGELREILQTATSENKLADEALVEAALARAGRVVTRWDKYFVEP